MRGRQRLLLHPRGFSQVFNVVITVCQILPNPQNEIYQVKPYSHYWIVANRNLKIHTDSE